MVSRFLAPGLLLDQISRRASEIEGMVTEPLGLSMAQFALESYDVVVRQS